MGCKVLVVEWAPVPCSPYNPRPGHPAYRTDASERCCTCGDVRFVSICYSTAIPSKDEKKKPPLGQDHPPQIRPPPPPP
eukprot:gene11109-biopygen6343